MPAVKPLEYTQNELAHMKREELETLAKDYGINGHLFKNRPSLVLAIRQAANNGEELEDKLTDREQEFCRLFASDREFFGNGTQSYIEAFEVQTGMPGSYDAARTSASELLMNPNILSRINDLMEVTVLNDTAVDRQLAFWMTQKAHPMAAVAAIREYNRLKKRVDDKLGNLKATLVQNNYNISIQDKEGQAISQKMTEYMLEITKAPQPVEGEVVS